MLTDPASPVLPRIFRNGRIVADAFVFVADNAPLPDGPVIVAQKRFLAERDHLLPRIAPLGVRLEGADSPELLRPDLSKLKLIELRVGHFKDGRAFSWARVLRTRLHFTGEIRVSGHFLLDQIAFFLRVGVDSFTLAGNWSQNEIERATGLISNVYQPSADHRPTIGDLRRRTLVTATAAE